MRQAIYNINAIKGDTWPGATFTITVNGAAIDLAGATVTMKIARPSDGAVLLTLDNGTNGGIRVTGANTFSVDAFIMTLDAERYDHDIQIAFADGTVKTYIKGKLCLIEDV